MIDQFPSFPLAAFFAADQPAELPTPNSATLPALAEADLIFGRDVSTGSQFLVFGRELLQAIVGAGMFRPVKGLVIEIDPSDSFDELERLCSLVQAIKGRHDYRDSETIEAGDDEE